MYWLYLLSNFVKFFWRDVLSIELFGGFSVEIDESVKQCFVVVMSIVEMIDEIIFYSKFFGVFWVRL